MMSSEDIIFAASDGLKPGMKAEIAVAWPRLQDDQIPLRLVLQVTITDSQYGVADARIVAYDFRTAGLSEPGQRAEPTGVKAPAVVNRPCAVKSAP